VRASRIPKTVNSQDFATSKGLADVTCSIVDKRLTVVSLARHYHLSHSITTYRTALPLIAPYLTHYYGPHTHTQPIPYCLNIGNHTIIYSNQNILVTFTRIQHSTHYHHFILASLTLVVHRLIAVHRSSRRRTSSHRRTSFISSSSIAHSLVRLNIGNYTNRVSPLPPSSVPSSRYRSSTIVRSIDHPFLPVVVHCRRSMLVVLSFHFPSFRSVVSLSINHQHLFPVVYHCRSFFYHYRFRQCRPVVPSSHYDHPPPSFSRSFTIVRSRIILCCRSFIAAGHCSSIICIAVAVPSSRRLVFPSAHYRASTTIIRPVDYSPSTLLLSARRPFVVVNHAEKQRERKAQDNSEHCVCWWFVVVGWLDVGWLVELVVSWWISASNLLIGVSSMEPVASRDQIFIRGVKHAISASENPEATRKTFASYQLAGHRIPRFLRIISTLLRITEVPKQIYSARGFQE
ncbi:hypothetical protein BC936DRAFT_146481, partial [Jimgerdemannia flammicorona]